MDNSFELASNTPISPDDLRAVDSRSFGGGLYGYYVQRAPDAAPAAVTAKLADVASLEEQVQAIGSDWGRLFTLANLFRATLDRPQFTKVPGHGTVSEVGIADGDLGVQHNLLVEGTLLVAGDLSVGGQLVVGDAGGVIVAGALHASAISARGQISVGADLRTMFVEGVGGGEGSSLDVGEVLDAFLLIQDDHVARAEEFSVGLHAVYPEPGAADRVFLSRFLDRDGKPDWSAVAQAAQDAEDIFVDAYSTPDPAESPLIELL